MQCGDTVLFWQDKWNGYELKSEMPELFSFAKKQVHIRQKGSRTGRSDLAFSFAGL